MRSRARGATLIDALRRDGLLPLRSFVRIDLDHIRAQLPETKTYMGLNKRTAGLLTQLEAGAIAEIATEEAYKQVGVVVIDCYILKTPSGASPPPRKLCSRVWCARLRVRRSSRG